MSSVKLKYYLHFLAVVAVLTMFFFIWKARVGLSSDSTTFLPMAQDILNGNIWLRGWIVGTNNFHFTETIFYAIGLSLGLSQTFLVRFISSFMYALLVSMVLLWWLKPEPTTIGGKINEATWFPFIVGIMLFIIIPFDAAYCLLNPNSHNNLYVFCIICLSLCLKYLESFRKRYLGIYIILASLIAFSESVTYMVLLAPVCAWSVFQIYRKHTIKPYIIIIGATILSYILSKGIYWLFDIQNGMYTRGMPIHLCYPMVYWERIQSFFLEYLAFFNIPRAYNLTSLNLWDSFNIFWIFYTILGFIIATAFIFKMNKKEQLLWFVAAINAIACIITDVAYTYRYLVPFMIFGWSYTLLATQKLLCFFRKKQNRGSFILYIGLFILFVTTGLFFSFSKLSKIAHTNVWGNTERAVVQVLKEKNWLSGYGTFWAASLLSFMAADDIKLYPVSCYDNENLMTPHPELVNTDWFKQENQHVVISMTNGNSFISDSHLHDVVGMPDETVEVGPYIIYYWKKDISPYVREIPSLQSSLSVEIPLKDMRTYNHCYVPEIPDRINVGEKDEGYVMWGPYMILKKGRYILEYTLNDISLNTHSNVYVQAEVCSSMISDSPLIQEQIFMKEGESITIKQEFELPYSCHDIEFRLFSTGKTNFSIRDLSITNIQ